MIMTDSTAIKAVFKPEQRSFYIDEFLVFIEDDLAGATAELGKLQDTNRIHIQKLIFTNLVDRFDYAVDKTLLNYVHHTQLRESLLKDMKDVVTDKRLIELLLKSQDELKNTLTEILQNELRSTVLRKRHSKKLEHLCPILMPDVGLSQNRVNIANGQVSSKSKFNRQIPVTILGYADWLYCRRNAVVHGGGTMKVSVNDLDHLKNVCKIPQPANSVKLNLGSIQNAANFYKSLIALFKFP